MTLLRCYLLDKLDIPGAGCQLYRDVTLAASGSFIFFMVFHEVGSTCTAPYIGIGKQNSKKASRTVHVERRDAFSVPVAAFVLVVPVLASCYLSGYVMTLPRLVLRAENVHDVVSNLTWRSVVLHFAYVF